MNLKTLIGNKPFERHQTSNSIDGWVGVCWKEFVGLLIKLNLKFSAEGNCCFDGRADTYEMKYYASDDTGKIVCKRSEVSEWFQWKPY